MVENKQCPECSARLNESSAGGPCPACLMKLGMNAWVNSAGGPTMGQPTAPPQGSVHSVGAGSVDEEIGLSMDSLQSLFPKLDILHLVGQGGMGAVYCARQKSLNRLVALKIVRPDAQKRGDFESRFSREARALASLNHENIITVHDFGQAGDLYFFIMEYVDGINLRQMLLGQKLTPTQALQIVPAICDALQYAHDHGVVHRDIKPENILIDTNGRIKIADFGLAKLLDQESATTTRLTQDHQVMGTMHYMAPEQFERPMDVDHRADIYSLGVVFYELLTGELPLGRFAPPSKKVHVDIRLDEIVLHTLEKEPSLRYQKVSDVKTDMQSLAGAPRSVPHSMPAAHVPVEAAVGHAAMVGGTTPVTMANHPQPVPPVKYAYPYPTEARKAPLTGPLPGNGFWGAWLSGQSYKNIGYLLASFPLGVLYFVLTIVGLSAGIGTVIVWVGLFILLGLFISVRGLVGFERWLARSVLQADVAPRRRVTRNPDHTTLQRAMAMFSDSQNWRGILYLIGKFPLGVVSFVFVMVFLIVPLALVAAPVMLMTPLGGVDFAIWEADSPMKAGFVSCVGGLLAILAIHGINGLAWLHAGWAKLCLGKAR